VREAGLSAQPAGGYDHCMKLPFDPSAAVDHLRTADDRLAAVIDAAGPFTLRPQRLQSPFDALMRAIVYQQLSGKAAATILARTQALFPTGSATPELLLEMSEERLRSAGLSRNKTASLKDLAAKTLDGTVPTLARLKKMEDEAIIAHLVAVRGIGRWTAEMLLIFRLGRADVLPVSDLGIRKGFQLTYRKRAMPDALKITRHAERWRPYRSVASWYLWRAVDLAKNPSGPPVQI
jgi:3-methyladenine DNA glycosylase/8-oxoguanine DNA glycosylase